MGRTAQLTSRRCILNTYPTNICTEYFKRAALSRFFSLQNAIDFIILPRLFCIIHILNTECAKILKKLRRQRVNVRTMHY
jgi:hypothetical protein